MRLFWYDSPQVIQKGLKIALSARLAEKQLTVLDSDALQSHKTGEFQKLIAKLGIDNFIFIGYLKVQMDLHFCLYSFFFFLFWALFLFYFFAFICLLRSLALVLTGLVLYIYTHR